MLKQEAGMVTDAQVRRLMKMLTSGKTMAAAAAAAGMDEKTARKYRRLRKLPSEVAKAHTWRTRSDPFAEVWEEVRGRLTDNPGLEAKTLFEDLQRRFPGRFSDGQLRTLQRRVKAWRAVEGPEREVFFPQVHRPGELCQSDFTRMGSLGVTITGQPFDHMIYHFVLTFSNWETGTICFSESFESLSEGLQNALWELGGVPRAHRTDRMTTAVNKTDHAEEFTQRYRGLLNHYGLEGRKIQVEKPNENGDVEQRHHRFKRALEQALLMRGSRDFQSRQEYEAFLRDLFSRLNAGRQKRLAEELNVWRRLPARRLDACTKLDAKVSPGSTIRIQHNVYSVHSRLIGQWVRVHLFADRLEVWYGQKRIETMPRLRGEQRHAINYRHVIEWLIRKPGAFENYRYREDLFPTSRFRMAYDALMKTSPTRGHKEYLRLLALAARENETAVDEVLRCLIDQGQPIAVETVKALVRSGQPAPPPTEVAIAPADLAVYDTLLTGEEVA
jgi:hypothetical protein